MARTPSAKRWTALIDQQEASGLTIRTFAELVGVNPRTLTWWRCQLGRSEKRKSSTFVEVTVVETPTEPHAIDNTVVLALDAYPAHVVVDRATDLGLQKRLLRNGNYSHPSATPTFPHGP